MVASGKISAAEGDALLEALRPKRRWSRFTDPFDHLEATRGLALGAATVAGVTYALGLVAAELLAKLAVKVVS